MTYYDRNVGVKLSAQTHDLVSDQLADWSDTRPTYC